MWVSSDQKNGNTLKKVLRKDTAGYAGFKEILKTETVSTRYQKFDQISYWLCRPDLFFLSNWLISAM